MDRRSFMVGGLGLAAGAAIGAQPAFAQLAALPYKDQQVVREAAAYLQDLKLAKGRFTQTSSRGGASSGQLYLSRPGKARFEYDAPARMLVVADGRNVSVYDGRLKTFNRYPLGATPLGIFLSRRIQLDEEVKVTNLTRNGSGFSIGLADARGNADGRLVLEFASDPLELTGWTVIDGQGVQTRVRLQGLTTVAALDPGLFRLTDPGRAAG